jgi:hypothetical protein
VGSKGYNHTWTLPEGPFIVTGPPPTGEVTLPPTTGEIAGRDVVNVWVDVEFTDGTRQTCKATVKAWTSEVVLVWAQAEQGQYVVWLPASKVRRRYAAADR